MSMSQQFTWNDFFPYSIRPAQQILVDEIIKAVPQRQHLVLEAANGTGKTIAALAGVLPYAKKYRKKVIYLARTHSQMDRVISELEQISLKTPVTGITMRGRDSMCLNDLVLKFAKSSKAASEMCRELKTAKKCQYFKNMAEDSRVNPILQSLKGAPANAEVLFELAESAEICPAELSRTMLKHAEVVACSYLYMFDPGIRDSFLDQLGVDLIDIILIIDEAHNLPETSVNVSSDEISTFAFPRAMREAKNEGRNDFVQFLEVTNDFLIGMSKHLKLYEEKAVDAGRILDGLEEQSQLELDGDFFLEMMEIGDQIRQKLARRGKEPRSSVGRIGEFFFNWYQSLGHSEFVHSTEKLTIANDSKNAFAVLRLTSLDPSKVTLPVLTYIHSSVHISGTIGNPEAYLNLIGLDQLDTASRILPSPYNHENIKVMVANDVSTLYKQRNTATFHKMVRAITALVDQTPANVGLFTPSYKILNELMNHGLSKYTQKPIYKIDSGLTSNENDAIISKFKKEASKRGALLCTVLGGRSSEGTDFKGDLMNAVIVVGLPYAPPNPRIDAKIAFLDEKFPGKGRLLAYTIPAVNRASQGAGRAVRSLSDKAFILFLDFRFNQRNIKHILPGWISENMTEISSDPQEIRKFARQFFDNF